MVCPPERGENPRALSSGLSPIQVDNNNLSISPQPTTQCIPSTE